MKKKFVDSVIKALDELEFRINEEKTLHDISETSAKLIKNIDFVIGTFNYKKLIRFTQKFCKLESLKFRMEL